MKQTLLMKIETFVCNAIRKICNHYYGCCQPIWRNCDRCKYVKGDKREWMV